MLTLDQKRAADAWITSQFLKDNEAIITQIINRFGAITKEKFKNYHFYLKGGNSITMLENMEIEENKVKKSMTGDYDFQFMPRDEDYANWPDCFRVIDQLILNALIASLSVIPNPEIFVTTALNLDTLKNWAKKQINRISFDDVTGSSKRSGLRKIGQKYDAESYSEIFQHEFEDNRLKIADDEIVAQDLPAPDKGPMIYVNYTIPGFILYRMVYSFSYQVQGGESYSLKSEIIDVSVPRKGSAEVYMSQEGVITHFRETEMGFKIPGWGYHFYENLNLLQEIELGTSGSVHKKKKREERCQKALSKLKVEPIYHSGTYGKAGKNTDYSVAIWEPHPSGSTSILNYLKALAHNVYEYPGYHPDMVKALREQILRELRSHLTTVEASRVMTEIRKLVGYKLDKKFDFTARSTGEIQEALNKVLNDYKSYATRYPTSVPINMIQEKNYWIISPYLEFQPKDLFPMDFVVITILSDVYQRFKDYAKTTFSNDVTKEAADGSAFLMTVHGKGAFYLLVQKCESEPDPLDTHLTQFLERSILESQRYALAKTLQPKSKP